MASLEPVQATWPQRGRAPQPVRRRRVCAFDDCDTILTRYNRGEVCFLHKTIDRKALTDEEVLIERARDSRIPAPRVIVADEALAPSATGPIPAEWPSSWPVTCPYPECSRRCGSDRALTTHVRRAHGRLVVFDEQKG